MTRKVDKLRLGRENDGRIKLTDAQRDYIRSMKGKIPKVRLAEEFGVSRRLIDFIQDPEKQARNKKLRQERGGWRRYYDKEKHYQAMKQYREKKARLLLAAEGGDK